MAKGSPRLKLPGEGCGVLSRAGSGAKPPKFPLIYLPPPPPTLPGPPSFWLLRKHPQTQLYSDAISTLGPVCARVRVRVCTCVCVCEKMGGGQWNYTDTREERFASARVEEAYPSPNSARYKVVKHVDEKADVLGTCA